MAAEGLHEGTPAGRRARRPSARATRACAICTPTSPTARPRSRGWPRRSPGSAVLVHRPRQGRLLGLAQPGRAAAPQAAGGDLRRHLHSRRARAPAARPTRDTGALRLPRPQRRPRATGRREPTRRSANGSLRVLGVGRLVPKKGFDTLVEAVEPARGPRGRGRGDARGRGRRAQRRDPPPDRGPRASSAGWSSPGRSARASSTARTSAPTSSACPAACSPTATATGSPTSSSRRWPAGCPSSQPPSPGSRSSSGPATTGSSSRPTIPRPWPTRCCDCASDPELAAAPRPRRARDRAAPLRRRPPRAPARRAVRGGDRVSARRADNFGPAARRVLPSRPCPSRPRRRRGGMRRALHLRRDDAGPRPAARLAGCRAARRRGVGDRVDEVLLRSRPRLRVFDQRRAALPAAPGSGWS